MADFFEFQESDIIFSDDISISSSNQTTTNFGDSPFNPRSILHKTNYISKKENSSVAVNIPGNFNSSSNCSSNYDEVEFNDDDDHHQIVPPHVIVDRRSGDFDGVVKISKPKNLIHFRNSVLKLTGFLES